MADSELTQGLIDYLKSDAVVLKQMAQDNKQANEVMKVTMDNLKETLIEIKDFMKGVSQGYVPVASDGGAPLKTAAATWYGQQITQTQRADLENESVKHGS